MKLVKPVCGLLILSVLFTKCTTSDEPSTLKNISVSAEKKISAPFHYQKAIEIKPGLTFDIMNWGRGADSTSAYLILRSDSAKSKFISTSGDLSGNIVDVWNMDMDSDGNPEIFIQTKNKKRILNLYVNEFDGSGSSQKLHFPDLSDATKKKYRGFDTLYVKNDKLMREFPLFKEGDMDNKPSDGRKYIAYGLNSNEFSVQNLNANGEPEKIQAVEQPKKIIKKKAKRRRR